MSMMPDNITKFPCEPVAECPECNAQKWYVLLDGYQDWKKINGIECVECGTRIVFVTDKEDKL